MKAANGNIRGIKYSEVSIPCRDDVCISNLADVASDKVFIWIYGVHSTKPCY